MFDPTSPVPGALVVRAWSTEASVAVEWPKAVPRPAALSSAVEQFCRGLAAGGDPRGAVEPDTTPAGPMIVHAFALTPELVDDDPDQPVGPGRPWGKFRQALIDEAIRRRPS